METPGRPAAFVIANDFSTRIGASDASGTDLPGIHYFARASLSSLVRREIALQLKSAFGSRRNPGRMIMDNMRELRSEEKSRKQSYNAERARVRYAGFLELSTRN